MGTMMIAQLLVTQSLLVLRQEELLLGSDTGPNGDRFSPSYERSKGRTGKHVI
jgi:hypothetical protein